MLLLLLLSRCQAVGWATGLAFGVAILASIGPIHSAMASSLRDALDFDRPKSTAVKYSIERAEDHRISWAVVAVGTGLVLFGFAIYYLIPLSLLSLNLELFVNVFFWILMASLIGMVMMAMNVEILVEVCGDFAYVYTFTSPALIGLCLCFRSHPYLSSAF